MSEERGRGERGEGRGERGSGGSRDTGGEGWRGRGDRGVEGVAGEEVHVGGGLFPDLRLAVMCGGWGGRS